MTESSNVQPPVPTTPEPKRSKRPFFLRWWFLTIIGVIVLAALVPKDQKSATETTGDTAVDATQVAPTSSDAEVAIEPAAAVVAEGAQWSYYENADKMGRGVTKTASVKSLNEFEFDFPYAGAQRATLTVRNHPEYGKDIYVDIERGQYQCGYDNCSVTVRFDDDGPKKFEAAEPADNSTTTLFLRGYDRFVKRLKSSKRVLIEAQFYQEGTRVFEFDVSGFKW